MIWERRRERAASYFGASIRVIVCNSSDERVHWIGFRKRTFGCPGSRKRALLLETTSGSKVFPARFSRHLLLSHILCCFQAEVGPAALPVPFERKFDKPCDQI